MSGTTRHSTLHDRRRFTVLAAALAATAGICLAAPTVSAASQPQEGYIRAAHLVPDLPEMDVYLSRFSGAGTGTQTPVLTIEAGYGDVGAYAPVAAGFYAVALRPAGSPAADPPILATTIEVNAGGVYPAAGVGTASDATLALFTDDLDRPDEGSSRVRVVNAARNASPADVRVSDGTTVATAAEYAVPTSYARVPAGRWTLTAAGSSGAAAQGTTDVDLASGAVYTLLLLEGASGSLQVAPVLDAAGSGVVPIGGAATGLGGTAEQALSASAAGTGLVAFVAVVVLIAAVAVALFGRTRQAGARHQAYPRRV